jgi:hypothetical protein
MRLPAQRRLELQAAYPSQAEGGFAGDLHKSLRQALVRWEQKRGIGGHFKYGTTGSAGAYRKEKIGATREEISWNAAPEVKREPKKREILTEEQRLAKLAYNRERRQSETPEEREARLEARRAWYLAKQGGKLQKRFRMSPEERKDAVKAAKQRYMERQKQGIVAKTIRKPSTSTAEQLARKAERGRKYYARNKQQHQTISAS